MGIMYKLMKHRNLNMDLSKPIDNTNIKSDRNRIITIGGNIVEMPLPVSTDSPEDNLTRKMDSNMDKQFTAEHIIQLCKFLAEKSKRNKNLYKLQQSPKKLSKSKQTQFTFQPMEYNDNDDEVGSYQNEAIPLISQQRHDYQYKKLTDNDNQSTVAVLSTRLSPDINTLNISSNNTTGHSCALQHYQQQQQQQPHTTSYQLEQQQQQHQQQEQHQPQPPQTQGKRDILLKIRRQIFERKRLRENGAFEPQALNNSQVWRPW